jgi:hypothetical protein
LPALVGGSLIAPTRYDLSHPAAYLVIPVGEPVVPPVVTGWQEDETGRFFVLDDGKRHTGWGYRAIHNDIIDEDMEAAAAALGAELGVPAASLEVVRFDDEGYLVTEIFFVLDDVLVYFATETGIVHRGMLKNGELWYFMCLDTGHAVYGQWIQEDGVDTYYAQPIGALEGRQGRLLRDAPGENPWGYGGAITEAMAAEAEKLGIGTVVVYFDNDGKLVKGNFFATAWDEENEQHFVYWAHDTGVVHRGMFDRYGDGTALYYMCHLTGYAKYGWIEGADGNTYYARLASDPDFAGVLLAGGVFEIGGDLHEFDENGVWLGLASLGFLDFATETDAEPLAEEVLADEDELDWIEFHEFDENDAWLDPVVDED